MYHQYFAIREEPFGVSPDGRYFFPTEHHREALATLQYSILQQRGFALLVGRAGLGKTSILVQLMQLVRDHAEIAFVPYPYLDGTTAVESILTAFGLQISTSPAENHRTLYEFFIKVRKRGGTCVLILDEAQELSRHAFEVIRMLSNFETPTEKLVQVILAGQPGLAENLQRPEFEQIRQRIGVVSRLKPLSSREVHQYVAHRLSKAGAISKLFTDEALDLIASASGGVPRNVNTICFNSLTLAYGLRRPRVGREEVEEAVHDLDLAFCEPPTASPKLPQVPAKMPQTQSGPLVPASKVAKAGGERTWRMKIKYRRGGPSLFSFLERLRT